MTMSAAQPLPPGGLTSQERFLLDWLSERDFSSYGECEGGSLNVLINCGLVNVSDDAGGRGGDYALVSLTEAGVAARRAPSAQEAKP